MSYAESKTIDDITYLLTQWQLGDRGSLDLLLTALYAELKRIAKRHLYRRPGGLTLFSVTVLVNEACLKLIKHRPNETRRWKARAEFFGLVSSVMLSVLADYSKRKKSKKNGGDFFKVPLSHDPPANYQCADFLILKDVLKGLEKIDARQCQIWKCRYLCGLSIKEIAALFQMGQSSIHRELKAGMGWVRLKLQRSFS